MGKLSTGASTNFLHILCDTFFFIIAFFASLFACNIPLKENFLIYFAACTMFMIIYYLSNKAAGVYNVTTFFYTDRQIKFITRSMLIATTSSSILIYFVGNAAITRRFYLTYLLIFYLCMIVSSFAVRYIITHEKAASPPRIALVGDIDSLGLFEHYLDKSNILYKKIGYISISPDYDQRYIGCIDDLENIVHKFAIDQIYLLHHSDDSNDVQSCIDRCTEMGITICVIMDSYKCRTRRFVSTIGTYPVVTFHTVTLNTSAKVIKRAIDIAGSLAGIIIASPVMLIVAIAVKLDSKGPVLFKQIRVGLNGRHFHLYKFRSMCADAEARKKELMQQNETGSELFFKIKDDPRVTRVGKFIRKTSLDELPQFFCVLKGDMSLVGTRPPTLDEVEHYERSHWRRMSIKPGITGMWQVSGRSQIRDFETIVKLDIMYIDKWSIWLDFKIMAKTVKVILMRKGAF